MIYRIEKSLFEKFPHFCRGVVVASEVSNRQRDSPGLERLFRSRIKEIEEDEDLDAGHDRIQAWNAIYRTIRQRGQSRLRPSVASLIRRIRKGKGSGIPFISPLVCISNIISLTHIAPSGLIDAERVSGDLVLGYASGGENFEPIGSNDYAIIKPGEIIYYDDGSSNVLCRHWNSRGGKAGAIRGETNMAVIDVDGLLNVMSRHELEQATAKAASLVKAYCGGHVQSVVMDRELSEFEISLKGR